jgi:hypothetical protein
LKKNKICDLTGFNNGEDDDDGDTSLLDKHYGNLSYNLKVGHWTGDDYIGDPSGYGRLNGCDDNSIYQQDRDCELWFDIYDCEIDKRWGCHTKSKLLICFVEKCFFA